MFLLGSFREARQSCAGIGLTKHVFGSMLAIGSAPPSAANSGQEDRMKTWTVSYVDGSKEEIASGTFVLGEIWTQFVSTDGGIRVAVRTSQIQEIREAAA